MPEEDEAKAGLVAKGSEYPKSQADVAAVSEYSKTYRFMLWPPTPSDEQIANAIQNWRDDAKQLGLATSKNVVTNVSGNGGYTFIEVTGRVRKASS